jgi:hypothetical protein
MFITGAVARLSSLPTAVAWVEDATHFPTSGSCPWCGLFSTRVGDASCWLRFTVFFGGDAGFGPR